MNIRSGAILFLAALAFQAQAAESDLARLAWLGGCWKAENGEPGSVEQWLPPAGGTMLGMSRTVKQGRTVAHEFMRIAEQPGGGLAFHAQPSGKPPDVFPARQVTATEVVFENPQHDFPQRIAYARDGDTRLNARIEGLRNGVPRTIPFPMVKVSCDAMLLEAGR